jgi:hypothetical protein
MKSFKQYIKEDLRNWFDKDHPDGGWKRINSKGEAVGPCAREPGEPKPKCMSNEKRAQLTKKERAAAVATKRKHDPNPERKGEPINVSNFGKGKISEDVLSEGAPIVVAQAPIHIRNPKKAPQPQRYMGDIVPPTKPPSTEKRGVKGRPGQRPMPTYEETEQLDEKNVPTSPDKWARAKAMAKSKFDVYPSAYANGWASKKYKEMGGGWKSVDEQFDMIEDMVEQLAAQHGVDAETIWEDFESVDDVELLETAAWRRKEGKNPEGGLNRKGIESYRRENPGSKLSMAVTTPPSKLKPGSKAANRRKSFCARMGGMEGPMKKPNGEPTRKALALRKWNC